MKIGLDFDNCITAYPSFFRVFTEAMKKAGHKIYIITNREPGTEEQIKTELKEIGISFDHIKITAKKAQYILAEGIEFYADDTDEYFLEIPPSVAVFKIREPGNFCFRDMKWCYSDRTGKKI